MWARSGPTGECTAEHIAAARMALLATKLCAIQITLHDIRSCLPLAASCTPFRLLVGMEVEMQSVSHCHKPRFLIAVGRVWDLWVLQ